MTDPAQNLPFYLNGTLAPDERKAVLAALERDETLRADLAFFARLQQTVQARRVDRSPAEFGLARLLRDIDAPAAKQPVWKRIAPLAAAVLVGALLLSVSIDDRPELAGARMDGAVLVAFRPDTQVREIRALLATQGIVIVDGPSALGLYTLSAVDHDPADIVRLLSAADIVESIEVIE